MNDTLSAIQRTSPRTGFALCMMASGAVAALIFAAGPLGSSRGIQIGFTVSLAFLAIGALLRQTTGRRARSGGSTQAPINLAWKSLVSLESVLHELLNQFDEYARTTMNPAELSEWIGRQAEPPMQSFLNQRQVLRDALGIGPFAEVMIAFSRMERSLHRSASAAADQYLDEARRCLILSAERMQDCLAALRRHLGEPFETRGEQT